MEERKGNNSDYIHTSNIKWTLRDGFIYLCIHTYIYAVIIIKGKDAVNLKGNKRGHDPIEGRLGGGDDRRKGFVLPLSHFWNSPFPNPCPVLSKVSIPCLINPPMSLTASASVSLHFTTMWSFLENLFLSPPQVDSHTSSLHQVLHLLAPTPRPPSDYLTSPGPGSHSGGMVTILGSIVSHPYSSSLDDVLCITMPWQSPNQYSQANSDFLDHRDCLYSETSFSPEIISCLKSKLSKSH